MNRAVRIFLRAILVIAAVLVALYGLFDVLYGGDSGGGDTYVTFFGHALDADLVGGLALGVASLLIVLAGRLGKRA